MKNKFLTKKELVARWSKSLVENFAPSHTVIIYDNYVVYQYDLSEVERIEQMPEFKQELKRINKQRASQLMPTPESYALF